jgi:thiamine biosynthesis protein ThiS
VNQTPGEPRIGVRVNGEARQVAAGATVAALLESMAIDPRLVAIELDGRIVSRAALDTVSLDDGARLEIVRFVQGG